MPHFAYEAVTSVGEVVQGQLDASDKQAVIEHLRANGQTPLRISAAARNPVLALLQTDVIHLSALSQGDILDITRSLTTLLNAGIELERALEMTCNLETKPARRRIVEHLLKDVREGKTLADALERQKRTFSPFYRAMVKAGEAGAALQDAFTGLVKTLEQAQKSRAELSAALIYPAFLILASLAAIIVLMSVVVPTFAPLFEEAGANLPKSTAIVIAIAAFLQSYWWALLLGLAGLAMVFALLNADAQGRLWWHSLSLRLPIIGTIWRQSATANVSRILSVLLANGVDLPQAMGLAAAVSSNAAIASDVTAARKSAEMGRGLCGALGESGHLPALALQLIAVGEESGRLAAMLSKTADIFDAETQLSIQRFLKILTPVLTLVIGLVIAFIVSSILFALFSINELARQ
jgi:general secretion pathway protein F